MTFVKMHCHVAVLSVQNHVRRWKFIASRRHDGNLKKLTQNQTQIHVGIPCVGMPAARTNDHGVFGGKGIAFLGCVHPNRTYDQHLCLCRRVSNYLFKNIPSARSPLQLKNLINFPHEGFLPQGPMLPLRSILTPPVRSTQIIRAKRQSTGSTRGASRTGIDLGMD